jgi:hypothetical protein
MAFYPMCKISGTIGSPANRAIPDVNSRCLIQIESRGAPFNQTINIGWPAVINPARLCSAFIDININLIKIYIGDLIGGFGAYINAIFKISFD